MREYWKMGRGQGTSQVIVFILALLIGSLVLIFGYTSLQKILGAAKETEMVKFQTDLESSLKGLSYGSTRRKALAVPGNYLAICFADLHYLRGKGESEFTIDPDYAIVKDSIFSNVESDVFLMPDGTISFYVGDLQIEGGFACFNLSAGRAEVGFEGLGNRTRVFPP